MNSSDLNPPSVLGSTLLPNENNSNIKEVTSNLKLLLGNCKTLQSRLNNNTELDEDIMYTFTLYLKYASKININEIQDDELTLACLHLSHYLVCNLPKHTLSKPYSHVTDTLDAFMNTYGCLSSSQANEEV